MASRLPQPKSFGLKKATSGSEANSSTLKMPEVGKNVLAVPEPTSTSGLRATGKSKSAQNVNKASNETKASAKTLPESGNSLIAPQEMTSTSGLKAIGKSKSTLNLNKASNENKPPVKTLLMRSQTSASIARKAVTINKTAVKRLGATNSGIESKRPNTRTQVRPTVSRPVVKAPVTGGTTGRVGISGAAGKPKPSKWDLKGRLELASSELSSLKEQHKKCAHLASALEESLEQEAAFRSKIEELETANAKLIDELEISKKTSTELHENVESLKTELTDCKKSHKLMAEALKKSEETCESQKKTLTEHASEVANLKSNLEEEKQANGQCNEKNQSLQSLVHRMDHDRRLLHNTIQELKGNIRVFCRVRPRIPRESTKTLCTVNFIDEGTMEVGRSDAADSVGKLRGAKQEFSFDKIFPPTASQAEVFEELQLLVQSALEGYNVCVFAYGQTGSGKTYTMEGGRDLEHEGMIPRTVRHIFREMKEFELLGWEYRIEASFLEIYNEHIVDLLDSQQKTHEIRMADSKGSDLYVSNLQVEEIHNPEELHQCLQTAQRNRAVAATSANERSSRSHSVARIRLIGTHAGKDELSIGNLNLVDLAGSERLKNEEAARTTETKNINKSLANLGNVILALLKKQDHVPYRNSKLTHLLMPALGGNSKTLMLLNVSPLDECFNETLNSLRFASNVNSCKTGNVKRSRQMLHSSM